MKLPIRHLVVLTAVACCAIAPSVSAQAAPPSIDDEIARLRKELIQTQVDCDRTVQEIEKDKKDFEAYRSRTAQRMAQTQSQLDTLKSEIAVQSRGNDALAAQISGVIAQRREIELSQDEFRSKLIENCNAMQPVIKKLPPLIMAPTLSGLSLLINDLTTKSTDIVDGCSRIVQILSKLDEASAGLQISQENSPAPDIRGMVYRLRIGTIFEGVVDTKGEKSAVFTGWGADNAPRWKYMESAGTSAAMLEAVNIREGRALPAFVNLPLAVSDSTTGGAK
jgi:TolA-binding protein